MQSIAKTDYPVYALALAIVAALGALNLHFPFVADQAVVLTGAKTIAAGGTLYVDFWDNKMPGLFWFYHVAGTLFGYTEFGVHFLDLIWMLLFSVLLMIALRDYLLSPWMSALAPIVIVGTYYGVVDPFHLTQLEGLVGFPIFLSAWYASHVSSKGGIRKFSFFLSGIFAGITVVFKLVFAPLLVVLWIIASLHARFQFRISLRAIVLNIWLPVTLGVVIIFALVVAKFWLDGALWDLYWTAFKYPPAALETSPPAPYLRLLTSSMFFVSSFLVWALFIALTCAEWWYTERRLLTSLMIGWLLAGIVLILIQRFSWWPYHFLTLFAPAGILGVRGVCVLPRALLSRGLIDRPLAVIMAIVLFSPAVFAQAPSASLKLSIYLTVFVKDKKDGDHLRRTVSPEYARIERNVQFLSSDTARPGKIYVLGDPLFYHLSGRAPALPIIGWPWDYYLQTQWVHLPRQLETTLPPYVYISKKGKKMIEIRQAGVREFINQTYVPFSADSEGTWFQVRPDLWKKRLDAKRRL